MLAWIVAAALAGMTLGRPARAAPADPCANATGYSMPEGVELSDEGDAGVAPADLEPSPIRQALPPTYRFPLAVDPLPDRLPNASIDLGEIEVDPGSGQARLNGVPLSKNDAADSEAGCRR